MLWLQFYKIGFTTGSNGYRDIGNYNTWTKFEVTVPGTGQQTVHDCDPWKEGNRGDKFHIYVGFLPRDTFPTTAQGSGVQTESSWVEKAKMRVGGWAGREDMAAICAAGY